MELGDRLFDKTIVDVYENAIPPGQDWESENHAILRFSDGTALVVSAVCRDDDVGLCFESIDQDKFHEWINARHALENREQERADQRAAWLALSCDERVEAKRRECAAWVEANGLPFMPFEFADELSKRLQEMNTFFGHQVVRCDRCGEAECERANVSVQRNDA